MALIGVRKAPHRFSHPNKLLCGSYVVELMLDRKFVDWRRRPAVLKPTLPWTLTKMFRKSGKVATVMFRHPDPLGWLKQELTRRRPVALFVRVSPRLPVALHWIVVLAFDDITEEFLVYDSRVGLSSVDPSLPVGNTKMSSTYLLEVWHGFPFFQYVAVTI